MQPNRVTNAGSFRVSIGLPVYNGENFLAQTFDSLLSQTFGDFELIVSDNASTDGTEAICREYAARDSRVRYVRQPTNRGLYWNFNRVAELATGEYLKWASHDDLIDATFLERAIAIMDADPRLAWCHSRSDAIDWRGHALGAHDCRNSGACEAAGARRAVGKPGSARAHERFREVMLGSGSCMDIYGLIRMRALRRTRLLLPYVGYEKVLMAELALAGPCHELDETLFHFRVHEGAASSMRTHAQQQAYADPNRTHRGSPRWHFLRGYLSAAMRSPLPVGEKLGCLAVIGRYLLQVNKWGAVIERMWRGRGVGGGSRPLLEKLEQNERLVSRDLYCEAAQHAG